MRRWRLRRDNDDDDDEIIITIMFFITVIVTRYKVQSELNIRDNLPCKTEWYVHRVQKKRDRQYFGRNFDKFRQLFIIFGTNHPDNSRDWKKCKKCPINTFTTLRNDEVIVTLLKNSVFGSVSGEKWTDSILDITLTNSKI